MTLKVCFLFVKDAVKDVLVKGVRLHSLTMLKVHLLKVYYCLLKVLLKM